MKSGPDVLKTFGLILWMIPTKRELLKSDVLQLSGLLAGDVKESRKWEPDSRSSNGVRPKPAS